MTLQEKNYILGFIEIANLNKDIKDLEKQLKIDISNLIPSTLGREKSEEIERKLQEFIFAIKWQYLEFGAYAGETLREWNLKYTPSIFLKEEKGEK